MKTFLSMIIRFYAKLLRLYPQSYRNEFAEEMLRDFSDMATDAGEQGWFPLAIFCLRELVDFPVSLLRVHLEESRMLKNLSSEPVNIGLRSAVLFGVTFGLLILMDGLASWLKPALEKFIPAQLPNLFVGPLLDWIDFPLTSLVFGILFAVLFADRARFSRYLLLGTLGWLLQLTTCNFLNYFFNVAGSLSRSENMYLYILQCSLSGAIFGLVFVLAHNQRWESTRLLTLYIVVYPILAYFYTSQVLTTSWRFIALVILWMALLGGIFALARKYDVNDEMIPMMTVGALGSVVLKIPVLSVAYILIPPVPLEGFLYDPASFWSVVIILMAAYILYGIFLGSLIGLVFGSQRQNSSPQLAV